MQETNLDILTNYVLQTYHEPVKKELLQVTFLLEKMLKVHGDLHQELFEISEIFLSFKNLFLQHMKKEENVLFPYMKALQFLLDTWKPLPEMHFQSVKKPIEQMEKEHLEIENFLQKLDELTHHFSSPEGACKTYQKCFSLLEKIFNDTQKHAEYENNFLHTIALKIEEKIKK